MAKFLFSAPCKTGFVQKRHFWLVGGDFCRNFIGCHLAFGKLNRKWRKNYEILAQNAKNGLKNRSLTPK
ncbi:MAG: hypothetical protein ACOYYJ_10720 [Chloroflexota bacterium]